METNNNINNLIQTIIGCGCLTNVKFIDAFIGNAPSGSSSFYTCPANRRALVLSVSAYNSTGSSIGIATTITISATTYFVRGESLNPGHTEIDRPIILEAGEIFGVNTSGTGINFWPVIIEYDNKNSLRSFKKTGIVSGNNTLYTVPVNKKTFITDLNSAYGYNPVVYYTFSGTPTTDWKLYVVNNGDTPNDNTNLIAKGTSFPAINQITTSATMYTGDYLVFNSTSSDTSQLMWANIYEE